LADLRSEREQLIGLEKLIREKKFAAALPIAEKLVVASPASFQNRLLYARILKGLEKLADAQALLDELAHSYPDNTNVLFELEDLCTRQQRYPEAIAWLNKIIFLDSYNLEAKARLEKLNELRQKGPPPPTGSAPPAANPPGSAGNAPTPAAANSELEIRVDAMPSLVVEAAPKPLPMSNPMAREEKPENPAALEIELPIVAEAEPPPPPSTPGSQRAQAEDSFATESAAEVYRRQGLFTEAEAIYEKLLVRTGEPRYGDLLRSIRRQRRRTQTQKKIDRLNHLLEVIRKMGE